MPDPIINRVYSLQIQGYDDAVNKVKELTAEFQKMDAAKTKLNAKLEKKLNSGDTATIQQLTDKIKELQKQMDQLSIKKNAINSEAANTSSGALKEISAYQNLIKQYKDAKSNAQEMAAQFGAESEQAKTAAASLAQYKNQLAEINALVKTGGVAPTVNTPVAPESTTPTNIPYSVHTDELAAERAELERTGTVVNELDQAQLDAQLSAQEWANSQKTVTEEVKQTGTTVQEIKGSFDQYTGTLRENITAQIENARALSANKEEQKQIATEMKAHGGATQEQITRLAALREQAVILTETNKQLTVTIRNQAQEFIAGTGSMDEMQAKINQLQQAYEQLSEEERKTPFGQGIKAEIDTLEPKIKELEGTIGKFQRNVGNYPNGFSGAFKTLNTELDSVQGKLVSGNFKGEAFDELTAKSNVLKNAISLTGKEFKTTAQAQAAFKEAAIQVGSVYGKDSEVFKNFSAGVKEGNVNVKGLATEVAATASKGKGFVSFLGSAYSGIKKLAFAIPGMGIAGVIALLLGPLQAAGAALVKWSNTATKGARDFEELNRITKETNSIVEKSVDAFSKATSEVSKLKEDVQLAKQGLLDQDKVLKEYNETMGKTTGHLTSFDQLEAKLIADGPAYIQLLFLKAKATAAYALAGEAAKKALTAQQDAEKDFGQIDFISTNKWNLFKQALGFGDLGQAGIDAANQVKKNGEKIKKEQEKAFISLNKQGDEFEKQAAALAKKRNFNFSDSGNGNKSQSSRLKDIEKEQINLIEANRARLLAIENTSVNEIQKVRELSFAEEKAHLLKVEQINVDALNNKIALLSQKKKLNAEEKKQLAEFTEQRSSIELDASKKVNDLLQKDFDQRAKKFKENLDSQIENAKAANKQIQDSVDADPSTKAQAQLDADNAILKAQVEFFFQMDFLEKAFNKLSKKNAEDRARDAKATNDAVNKDRKAVSVSVLSDIEKDTNEDVARIKLKYEQLIQDILKSNKSLSDKDNAIKILVTAQNLEVKGTEQKGNNKALEEATKLFEENKLTAAEFVKIYEAANKGQLDLNAAIKDGKTHATSFSQLLGNSLGKVFGFDKNKDGTKSDGSKSKALGEIIAQSFQVAGEAMNTYFDNEAQRIQRNNELTQQKLDIELGQAKSRAQSQAEQDSLERQFAAKKEKANKEAFEKDKKLKKQQLIMNFAIQLSNIAVAASANPLNPLTFGAAGILQYIIQAAIATAAFGINLANINKSQYAKGGLVKAIKIKNGRIDNPSNIPTQPNGDNILATVRTNEVILNEEQQRRLGGPSVFKSIGVPGFATGGKVDYASFYGFMPDIGKNWNSPAPMNPGAYLNPGRNNNASSEKTEAQLNALMGMIAETSRQTNLRIDKIKVQVVAKEVDETNNETKKAVHVGRL